MLNIRIGESWTAVEPSSLAGLILDGQVGELAPARDLTQAVAEGPLGQFLTHRDFEEISRQLLERMWAMYRRGARAANPREIRARVVDLSRWKWGDPFLKGRLLWVAGWLEELAGSSRRAVGFYDQYLLQDVQEPPLTLLALNNRGRLRIAYLHDAQGVRDLARAAFLGQTAGDVTRQPTPLPAACFNLLNLINEAAGCESLCDPVEEVLVDFMISLPQEVREEWLGPDPDEQDTEQRRKGPVTRSGEASDPQAVQQAVHDEGSQKTDAQTRQRKELHILRDPTFKRLNTLAGRLLRWALEVVPQDDGDAPLLPESVAAQLQLWAERPAIDVAGDVLEAFGPKRTPANKHSRYAEAATLLYVCDIHPPLVATIDSLSWTIRFVREELGRADSYVDDGAYEPARRVLEALHERLSALKGGAGIDSIVQDVVRKLAWVVEQQQERDRLELHQAYSELVDGVDDLCRGRDLCSAERQANAIRRQLAAFKARFEAHKDIWTDGTAPVLEDLEERIEDHVRLLRRSEVEERVKEHRETLLALWPSDWNTAVDEKAYEALEKCWLNDPEGLLADWKGLKVQLDGHQAQCCLRQALRGISAGRLRQDDARELLVRALAYDVNVGPAVAPIFVFFSLSSTSPRQADLEEIRSDLLSTASQLLETQPLDDTCVTSPAVRKDLVRRACLHLQRLVRLFHGVGEKVTELWDCLESGFRPALDEGRPHVVDEIEQMLDACLEACPTYAPGRGGAKWDPRNRLWILRETCEIAGLIGRGEQALAMEPPDRVGASKRFTEAIRKSPAGKKQWPRAVGGLYAAQFGDKDPTQTQRKVLDGLDQWLDQEAQAGRLESIRIETVTGKIAELRSRLGLARDSRTGPSQSTGADVEANGPSARTEDEDRQEKHGPFGGGPSSAALE